MDKFNLESGKNLVSCYLFADKMLLEINGYGIALTLDEVKKLLEWLAKFNG